VFDWCITCGEKKDPTFGFAADFICAPAESIHSFFYLCVGVSFCYSLAKQYSDWVLESLLFYCKGEKFIMVAYLAYGKSVGSMVLFRCTLVVFLQKVKLESCPISLTV
jgi:predicted acyltransferase